MLKAVFFDLDGTLLPMDENYFVKVYFKSLCNYIKPLHYDETKIISCLKRSIKMFYENDGKLTNADLFWNLFKKEFPSFKEEDKFTFDEYYRHIFKETKISCKDNPLAREIIDFVHENVQYCILTTNPILPALACYQRLEFINLKKEDFDFITLFEEFKYSKPNPKYFEVVLNKFNLKSDEVILFGNNDYEDYLCAKKVGIKTYLIKGSEILHPNLNLDLNLIEMQDVINIIENEIKLRS